MRNILPRLVWRRGGGISQIRARRASGWHNGLARVGSMLLVLLALMPSAALAQSSGCSAILSSGIDGAVLVTGTAPANQVNLNPVTFNAGEVLTYTYTAQAGSVPRVQYRTGTPGAQGSQTDTFTSPLVGREPIN